MVAGPATVVVTAVVAIVNEAGLLTDDHGVRCSVGAVTDLGAIADQHQAAVTPVTSIDHRPAVAGVRCRAPIRAADADVVHRHAGLSDAGVVGSRRSIVGEGTATGVERAADTGGTLVNSDQLIVQSTIDRAQTTGGIAISGCEASLTGSVEVELVIERSLVDVGEN